MKAMVAMVLTAVLTSVVGAPLLGSALDDKIESSFRNSYVWKTYLKDDAVKIKANDGIVTLTGTVSEESHKSLAGETAAGLPGVTRVDNQLEVKSGHDANSDVWIAAKVKATLLFHSKVSAGTEVSVNNGVVTLSGTADSADQKVLTSEYAKGVDGVTEVKNNMTVSKTPSTATKETSKAINKIDDASITAQAKMALLFDRSTSSLKTTVKTTNGIVTLTGKAATTVERDKATKLVSDIHGVKRVRNQMTI